MRIRYIYTRKRWLLLFGLIDRLGFRLHPPQATVADLSGTRSILLMKLDQVGDLILTLPLIHALRKAAPSARLELAVARGRSLVFEEVEGVDMVHELPVLMRAGEGRNEIRFAGLWRSLRRLRKRRFDAVVSGKEDPATVLFSYLVGAPIRVGFIEGGLGFLLTHYTPIPSQPLHQWEILASLSGLDRSSIDPPCFPISDATRAEALDVERQLGGDSSLPLVVVHPGAGIPERQWPLANFLRVVSELSRKRALRFIVVRGPDDLADLSAPSVKQPSHVAVLERPVSLSLLAALLSRAAIFLGNESGPSHLAASVGTPAVVPFLYGTDPYRWGPYGSVNRVVTGPIGKGPDPESVVAAAAELLSRSG